MTCPTTLIDGRWQRGDSSRQLESVNPATEEILDRTDVSSDDQVDAAVRAARRALEGPWGRMTPDKRAAALLKMADILDSNAKELTELVMAELGTPAQMARATQVTAPAGVLRWYAEACLRGPRGGYEEHLAPAAGTRSMIRRVPVGVVAVMPAYNFPVNLMMWKLGGVIASGCTAVLLPPAAAWQSVTHFVRVMLDELELPAGVINMVVGGPETGTALTSHPGVDMISFTGSDAVGSRIAAQAAPALTKVVLELGGKAASIVLPGTPLRRPVEAMVHKFSRNAGQQCGAWTRILVHRDSVAEFAELADEAVTAVRVGDPYDPETVTGPLISAGHLARIKGQVDAALGRGATVLASGSHTMRRGYFLSPLIIGNVSPDDPIAQQELFAPVAVLLPYSDVDEAVQIANSTVFGLNANVFGPVADAVALAPRLRAGTVTINGGGPKRPDAPWSGWGRSGIGTELGLDGFAEFFAVQHVQWPVTEEEAGA